MRLKITIDFRRLIFFGGILAVVGLGWWGINRWQEGRASSEISYSDFGQTLNFVLDRRGNLYDSETGQKAAGAAARLGKEYDVLKYPVLQEPGFYLDEVSAVISLPKATTDWSLQPRTYGIHGIEETGYDFLDETTLNFWARGVNPSGVFTIEITSPKGYLEPAWPQRLWSLTANLPLIYYLTVAAILPALAWLLVLINLGKIWRRRWLKPWPGRQETPPDNSSPALVGVLHNGRMGSREIAATIIDLASRGWLIIVQKGQDDYHLGQRRRLDLTPGQEKSPLRIWEKNLLEKLFLPGQLKIDRQAITQRLGRHLFSQKIARIYLDVYNQATRQGYFLTDPRRLHWRWKLTAISLFAGAVVAMALTVIFAGSNYQLILIWLGLLLASWLLLKTSGQMPLRTGRGQEVLRRWLAFRRFLSDSQPISIKLANQFGDYLSYAIVLDGEEAWAGRFMQGPFVPPDWFVSAKDITSVKDFAAELYPFITWLCNSLAASRDPDVS